MGAAYPQKAGITLGSFEIWGKWVRDPLLALGCKDPVARLSEIKARDPERQRVVELFNAWWEAHADTPVKASELAPEVKEIADPSQDGRQYLARAIGNLAGTRQGGFMLERFGELPNARKGGAKYRLRQVLRTIVPHESSASSASSACHEKSAANSASCAGEKGADDLRMSADDPSHPRPQTNGGNTIEINSLADGDAGNADDADAIRAPRTNTDNDAAPFPGTGGGRQRHQRTGGIPEDRSVK